MAKSVRVHQLAKELGLSNDEMIQVLRDEGIEVTSNLSGVDAELAELVREHVRSGQAEPAAGETAEPAPAEEEDPATAIEAEFEEAAEKDRRRRRAPRRQTPAEDDSTGKKARKGEEPGGQQGGKPELHLKPPIILKDLAKDLGMKPNTLIQELMKLNVFASINQAVDVDVAAELCERHGRTLVTERRQRAAPTLKKDEVEEVAPEQVEFEDARVQPRAPVVAFLGHVDHGKTSLQDYIRKTDVTAGEAGGITQHIGASTISWEGHDITFVDTPGHEAFTAMRARGANVTDIVVLVVAADDGFMPQTVEALDHARAAGVPIIVAANKIDLPGADLDRILLQMQQNNLMPEEWGGETGVVPTSATTGDGIENLLERIVLEAELLELKGNPDLPGRAVVIESQIEQGLGTTANILVKNGSVKIGDVVVCGEDYGKVKALVDSRGKRLKAAGPSTPVKLCGLNGLPECGAILAVIDDEKEARRLADERQQRKRRADLEPQRKTSLEDLFEAMEREEKAELNLILKTDVAGTGEAVADQLTKIGSDKIDTRILHQSVGAVTENDVLLASASDAIIVGFHVRINPGVNALAKREGVEIRLYSIIYELIDDMKQAMAGMLAPEVHEQKLGNARILQVFLLSNGDKVCGCQVTQGIVRVGAHARVSRRNDLIYNGAIASLRHYQDDVKEMRQGQECGIRLDNFNDFEEGDTLEVYDYIQKAVVL